MIYQYIMSNDVEFRPLLRGDSPGALVDPARPVTAHGRPIEAGRRVMPHAHPRAQLIMILSGVMRLEAGSDTWIVPSGHCAWVPGGLDHALSSETDMETCNAFIDPAHAGAARVETACRVLRLTPLLREMAARLSEAGRNGSAGPEWQRLGLALIDEIARLEVSDLGLPGGRDPRLVRLTRHLNRTPAEPRGLGELAREVAGSSERSLARLFREETGLSYRQWRTRQRMLVAMQALDQGQSSAEVAATLGYGSASAFIAAFRRTLGAPPQQARRRMTGAGQAVRRSGPPSGGGNA